MGIIQRQGIKQSMVTYFGIAIGMLNIFLVYPSILNQTQFGFFQYLKSIVSLSMPFILLGTSPLIIRYFPYFKNKENGHNGFLFFMLSIPILCFIILSIGYFLFRGYYFDYYTQENDYLEKYSIYLLPWLLFVGLCSILTRYISNFKRIVVPAIFNDLFVKIGIPICCILFYFGYIGYEGIIQGAVVVYGVVLLALILYARHLGELHLRPNFGFIDKVLFKDMATFNAFGIIGSIGNAIVLQLDIYMVGTMISFTSAAIYTIPLFVSNVIDVPKRAITSIASPIISEAWKKNDLAQIKELYSKTSLNQFIPGLLLLIGIWASVDSLYNLIPEGPNKESYIAGKNIILILGASKLIDMVTGVNTEIIAYSKYYKFNFYAVIFLAIFTIISNLIWIPIYGIEGAAIATMTSFGLFNLTKVIFLKLKLNIQPFSWSTLVVLLIGSSTYFVSTLIPNSGNTFIDIIIKSFVILIMYSGLILSLKVSEDINNIVLSWKKKILG